MPSRADIPPPLNHFLLPSGDFSGLDIETTSFSGTAVGYFPRELAVGDSLIARQGSRDHRKYSEVDGWMKEHFMQPGSVRIYPFVA